MPRQVDLFRQNVGVSHNPTQNLGVSTIQALLTNGINGIPELTVQFIETAINNLLGMIDQVTGLNLKGFALELEALVGEGGDLLAKLISYLEAIPLEALPALEQLLSDVGVDTIDALGDIITTAESFSTGLQTLLDVTARATLTDLGDFINEIQGILDAIANAFGQAGTGHTTTQVEGYLTAIPGSVISGITAVEQSIIDNICNALEITGSGHVVGDILTALENIPNDVVAGIDGFGTDIGSTVTNFVSAFLSPWAALIGDLTGSAAVAAAATTLLGTVDSASAIATSVSDQVTKQAISNPAYIGLDASADSVFPIHTLNGSSPTTVNVTQSNSLIGFIGITSGNGMKESVAWFGQTAAGTMAGITGFFINIYKVSRTDASMTQVYGSANIVTAVSGALGWNFYNLPSADYFTSNQAAGTTPADCFAVELQIFGSGTYEVVGIPNHWLSGSGLAHPTVFPQQLAASRNILALGAGNSGTGSTVTESHTANTGDDVFAVHVVKGGSTSTGCTFGGTSMTLVGSANTNNNSSTGSVNVYRIAAIASSLSGAQNCVATETSTSNTATLQTASFPGVTSVGTPTTAYGSSSSPSQSVTVGAGQFVLQVFGVGGTTHATAASGGMAIYNSTSAAASNQLIQLVTASATVGATLSASDTWAGIAVPITAASILAQATLAAPVVSPTAGLIEYSGQVPWFALNGSPGRSEHQPVDTLYSAAGTYTHTIPSWIEDGDYVDVVGVGGGGLGSGHGGAAGVWFAATLRFGDAYDIPTATTTFTVTVGAAGTVSGGGDGGATSVTITGYGGTLSGAGGVGGGNSPSFLGASPGNETLNGTLYTGGGTASYTSAGHPPGGGGGLPTDNSASHPGAAGAAWITEYQQ